MFVLFNFKVGIQFPKKRDTFEDPVSISSSFETRNGMMIPSGEKLPLLSSFPGIHTTQDMARTLVLPSCDLTASAKLNCKAESENNDFSITFVLSVVCPGSKLVTFN